MQPFYLFGIPIQPEITISDIFSAVIAIIAVFIAFFSLLSQRKHDRLTYKPIPRLHFIASPLSLRVSLQNKGNGPLLVKSSTFRIREDKANYLKELLLRTNAHFKTFYSLTGENIQAAVIPPGQDFILLEIANKSNLTEVFTKFTELLKDISEIKIFVEYTDIYERRQKEFTQDFTLLIGQYQQNLESIRKVGNSPTIDFPYTDHDKNIL